MGITASILSAAATVGNAASSFQQAGAVRAQSNFEGQLAELSARDAIARGDYSAQLRRQQGARVIGAQRAAAGASGIDPNSGSARLAQTDEAAFSELDAHLIQANAAREAWGYRANQMMGSMAASNTAAALEQQGVTTLLTGAGKTYGLYSDARKRQADANQAALMRIRVPSVDIGKL